MKILLDYKSSMLCMRYRKAALRGVATKDAAHETYIHNVSAVTRFFKILLHGRLRDRGSHFEHRCYGPGGGQTTAR